jgi:hypothetical protein
VHTLKAHSLVYKHLSLLRRAMISGIWGVAWVQRRLSCPCSRIPDGNVDQSCHEKVKRQALNALRRSVVYTCLRLSSCVRSIAQLQYNCKAILGALACYLPRRRCFTKLVYSRRRQANVTNVHYKDMIGL